MNGDIPDNTHYAKLKIEPLDYAEANEMDILEFSIIKYVSRWKFKNGLVDLKKAQWYLDRLIAREERFVLDRFMKREKDT